MVLTHHARDKLAKRNIAEQRIAHALQHGTREPRNGKWRTWLQVDESTRLGIVFVEEGGEQVVVTVFERRPFQKRPV